MQRILFLLLLIPPALTAQVRPKLNIGIVLPRTGPLGLFGEQTLKGAQLAFEEVKAKDGKLSELVNIQYEDSGSSFDLAREAAERLITQKKVDILFGGLTSSVSLALADVAHDTRHPFLTPLATHLDVTRKSRYVFRSTLTDPEQGTYAANFVAEQLKFKKAAIVYSEESSYSRQLMRTFEHRFKKMGGQIVAKESVGASATDYQATLTAIKRSRPDIVFLPVAYNSATRILKQAKEIALNSPFLGTESWNSPSFFQLLDKYSSRGHYFVTNYYPTDLNVESKDFVERYRSAYREPPSYYSAMGYDGMMTILDAYQRTKGDVSTALVRSLGATQDAVGVLGPIRLNRFRNAIKPIMVMQTTANGPKFHSIIKAVQ